MAKVRIATRIDEDADRRLRMLALIQRRPLSYVLSALIVQNVPPADVLAGRLALEGGDAA